jgi:hypothetical protein
LAFQPVLGAPSNGISSPLLAPSSPAVFQQQQQQQQVLSPEASYWWGWLQEEVARAQQLLALPFPFRWALALAPCAGIW